MICVYFFYNGFCSRPKRIFQTSQNTQLAFASWFLVTRCGLRRYLPPSLWCHQSLRWIKWCTRRIWIDSEIVVSKLRLKLGSPQESHTKLLFSTRKGLVDTSSLQSHADLHMTNVPTCTLLDLCETDSSWSKSINLHFAFVNAVHERHETTVQYGSKFEVTGGAC